MPFPAAFLDELVERSDITEVVSEYVQLKRSGTNLFGICPFHSEKTASFSVAPDKQIYHCFGCGVGGGVINFIMKAENLDYPDAVRFLAARAGMSVPEDGDADASKRRAALLSLNKEAARFFYESLMGERGGPARQYLKERGITERTVKRFGLGYAADEWDGLIKAVKGYEKSDFLDGGLAIKNKSGGIFDRFRGRIMFPIIDVRENVIGFGGRVMDGSQPKYMNSPETPVYNKSKHLFAMNIARKARQESIILAEGYMDVISLHQAGFSNAVASLGTSLTEAQARLISKYAGSVTIAYDSDAAGRTAADRAIKLLEKTGLQVRILDLPGAKDPDEYIKKFGSESLKLRLERSDSHIEYKLNAIREKYNLSDSEQRVLFLKAAAALLGEIDSRIERVVYAGKVAELGGVSAGLVEDAAELEAKKKRGYERQKEVRQSLRPAINAQPKDRSHRYGNIRSAVAEEGVIFTVLTDDSFAPEAFGKLSPADFSSELLAKIFAMAQKLYEEGRLSAPALGGLLEPGEMEHLGSVLMKEAAADGKALGDYIDTIKREAGKRNAGGDTQLLELAKLKRKKGMEDTR
ncbi:MAG: DNA primase [Oscillospiraceae bacterium]|jgi:DNA primase|nr:DNA primase [Oscillospiraceae bacterium]